MCKKPILERKKERKKKKKKAVDKTELDIIYKVSKRRISSLT